MTKALTLRLPDRLHEQLRQEAFDKRVSVTSLIVDALAERRPTPAGCDVCGKPSTHISTPGGIRFCDAHASAARGGGE